MMNKDRDRRGILWVILIISWLLCYSLIKDMKRVQAGFDRIADSEQRLEEVKTKNTELKKKLLTVETAYFKEKTVREKLNMQRPGEVVVLWEGETKTMEKETKEAKGEENKPNWQKWGFLWQ